MILAIDMGNTNIVIGCIDNEKIYFVERLSTDKTKTALEYAFCFKTVLELYNITDDQIEGSIISSVVPALTKVLSEAIVKIIGFPPMVVGPGVKTGLSIHMDNPKQVGSDLIVDAVAGTTEYGVPLVVIDMGTAITMSVIDSDKHYIGGVIMPGLRLSVEALASNAAQLYNVGLDAPRQIIGKNTSDCMKSGIIIGNAACIDGMIDRFKEELGIDDITVVATGGMAKVVTPFCKHKIIADDTLLLKGLNIIYHKNKD